MTGHACIDVHDRPESNPFGGRRLLQPLGNEWIVNDCAESRLAPGQSNGTTNVVPAGGLPRQEHTFDT